MLQELVVDFELIKKVRLARSVRVGVVIQKVISCDQKLTMIELND